MSERQLFLAVCAAAQAIMVLARTSKTHSASRRTCRERSSGSFCANRGKGDGPRVLHGPDLPELYGLPNLEPHEKETVRIGTLLAIRTAEASNLMWVQGFPFWVENPARRAGTLSLFNLPEMVGVAERQGVTFKYLAQCELGAPTTKPTDLFFFRIDLDMLPSECTHP